MLYANRLIFFASRLLYVAGPRKMMGLDGLNDMTESVMGPLEFIIALFIKE